MLSNLHKHSVCICLDLEQRIVSHHSVHKVEGRPLHQHLEWVAGPRSGVHHVDADCTRKHEEGLVRRLLEAQEHLAPRHPPLAHPENEPLGRARVEGPEAAHVADGLGQRGEEGVVVPEQLLGDLLPAFGEHVEEVEQRLSAHAPADGVGDSVHGGGGREVGQQGDLTEVATTLQLVDYRVFSSLLKTYMLSNYAFVELCRHSSVSQIQCIFHFVGCFSISILFLRKASRSDIKRIICLFVDSFNWDFRKLCFLATMKLYFELSNFGTYELIRVSDVTLIFLFPEIPLTFEHY